MGGLRSLNSGGKELVRQAAKHGFGWANNDRLSSGAENAGNVDSLSHLSRADVFLPLGRHANMTSKDVFAPSSFRPPIAWRPMLITDLKRSTAIPSVGSYSNIKDC